jgi:hypothetical protein
MQSIVELGERYRIQCVSNYIERRAFRLTEKIQEVAATEVEKCLLILSVGHRNLSGKACSLLKMIEVLMMRNIEGLTPAKLIAIT